MSSINLDDIPYDFGFSTISEEEYNAKIVQTTAINDTPEIKQDLLNHSNQLDSIERKVQDILNMIDYQTEESDRIKDRLNNTYIERMKVLEQLIIPLLTNLLKTSDNEYIYWPNRRGLLEKQIEQIKSLTRDENIFVD